MHIAESLDEIELLQSGSGRLVELLDSLNAFPRGVIARGTRPLHYLQMLAQAAKSLVIHGNYLSQEEIAFLGQRSETMSVVYCPRTHAYFNAGDYPLAEMLAANINVCLGTDSRASNPDLNLFEEMRFVAQRYPNVTPEGVLYLGTQAGADALGLGDRFGSIAPRKSARLTTVPLALLDASDPHELLFAAS
jgi:aminodeoxyfutalosine deaminase